MFRFKNLNESLGRLESQVYSLLKIQQQKCAEIQNLAPSYARIPENLNVVQLSRVKSGTRFDSQGYARYYQPSAQVATQSGTSRTLYQPPQYNAYPVEVSSTGYVNYMEEYVQDYSGNYCS